MANETDTNDDADADRNNKKINYSLESKLAPSNLDNNSHNTDITAQTTIDAAIYCKSTLEAWTSLKGIDSMIMITIHHQIINH